MRSACKADTYEIGQNESHREKMPNRAGATPLFRLSAAQKVRGVAPALSQNRRRRGEPRKSRARRLEFWELILTYFSVTATHFLF